MKHDAGADSGSSVTAARVRGGAAWMQAFPRQPLWLGCVQAPQVCQHGAPLRCAREEVQCAANSSEAGEATCGGSALRTGHRHLRGRTNNNDCILQTYRQKCRRYITDMPTYLKT